MKTKKIQLNSSIQYLLMIVVALIMVFPFFWILSSSLKDALEFASSPQFSAQDISVGIIT
jgi:ABC-type glycerol-3-phosphate transport system permease component